MIGLLVVEDDPNLEESNLKIEVFLFKWFVHRKLLANCEKISSKLCSYLPESIICKS